MGTTPRANSASLIGVYQGALNNCAVVADILKATSLEAVVVSPAGGELVDGGEVLVPLGEAHRARLLLQKVAPANDSPAGAAEASAQLSDEDVRKATAEVRKMVATRKREAVTIASSARSKIWPRIILLYFVFQVVYAVGRRGGGPIASGALVPIFLLLAGTLYVRSRLRLEPVERLIYRETTRYAAAKRWWPSIMALLSGGVLLSVTAVTIGDTKHWWVTPIFLLLSLALIAGGGLVIWRKVKGNDDREAQRA